MARSPSSSLFAPRLPGLIVATLVVAAATLWWLGSDHRAEDYAGWIGGGWTLTAVAWGLYVRNRLRRRDA